MGFLDQWKQGRIDRWQSQAWDAFGRNDAQALLAALDAGASADLLNGAGQSLVHRLILEDRPLLEKPLSRPSVNWALALPDGRTALHLAVESGQSRWVKVALDHGVPLERKTIMGCTALHLAARQGAVPIIRMLDGAGASWLEKDKRGQTPLDAMAENSVLHTSWSKILSLRAAS